MTRYAYTVPQKVSFRPKTGPEFPQYDQNLKLFGTNLFLSAMAVINIFPGVQIFLPSGLAGPKKFWIFLSFWGKSGPVSGRKLTSLGTVYAHFSFQKLDYRPPGILYVYPDIALNLCFTAV